MANEPVAIPTAPLASVSTAEAAMEVSATCSFSCCMSCFGSQIDRFAGLRGRTRHGVENADIGKQLGGGEAIRRAALHRVGPGLEVQPHGIDVVIAARFAAAIRSAMHEARRNALVDIAAFLHLDPALVAD